MTYRVTIASFCSDRLLDFHELAGFKPALLPGIRSNTERALAWPDIFVNAGTNP